MATSVLISKDDNVLRRIDITLAGILDLGITDVSRDDLVIKDKKEYLLIKHYREMRLADAQSKAVKALSVCCKSAGAN